MIDVFGDRASGVARMARPEGVLTVASAGVATGAVAMSVLMFVEASRHPEQALAVWVFLWGFSVPVSVGLGVLLARSERALTGLSHPRRWLWAVAAFCALSVAHWVALAGWVPALMVKGLMGPRYRLDDAFEGALLVSPSAVLIAFSGLGLYGLLRVLRARSWDGLTATGRSGLPRIPTAPILGITYGVCVAFPALLACVFTMDGGLAVVLIGWTIAGVTAAGGGARYGAWVRQQLPANGSGPGFAELFGALWWVHWGLPFALLLLPAWDRDPERLIFAVFAAVCWVTGVGIWSAGRHRRFAPA